MPARLKAAGESTPPPPEGTGRQAQPSIREATVHTQTHPTTDRRFVDPEELICPGCGEQVRCAPPDGHVVDGLPVPQFSHPDATALCRTRSGAVAEPVEEAW